jgi:HSP20 family protein
MLSFPEVNELSEQVRRVFEEFDRQQGGTCRAPTSVYAPALDVVETADSVEVYVDVPGVALAGIRVLFKDGSLIVVGEKLAAEPCGPDGAAFHLVERGFGRFARVIRLNTAVDASAARAVLHAGELHVSVPRLDDRRGREIVVPVEEATDPPA